jgi:hypothetical protein
MSGSTLRRVRRLKAQAGPIIAELGRRKSEWENSLPSLAEDHLLRIIAVFQYGEPRIDEALAPAYRRALSKLDHERFTILGRTDEEFALLRMREILEKEPPVGEIKSKICSRIGKVPDWLRYFCCASISTTLLGMEHRPLPQNVFKLKRAKSDRDAWPYLPQGVLEPRGDQSPGDRFLHEMSLEELTSYIAIRRKPEHEWTRHEHRFIKEMHARESSTCGPDSVTTESEQKEHATDNSDDGAGQSG